MSEKDEFIQYLSNNFLKSDNFRGIKERSDLWNTIVKEYGSAYYHSKIPAARQRLEERIVFESISYALNYLSEIIKK